MEAAFSSTITCPPVKSGKGPVEEEEGRQEAN